MVMGVKSGRVISGKRVSVMMGRGGGLWWQKGRVMVGKGGRFWVGKGDGYGGVLGGKWGGLW